MQNINKQNGNSLGLVPTSLSVFDQPTNNNQQFGEILPNQYLAVPLSLFLLTSSGDKMISSKVEHIRTKCPKKECKCDCAWQL